MSLVVWKRYTIHAAHAHIDGKQLCHILHGQRLWGSAGPREPDLVTDFAPTGLPWGKVCARCQKLAKEAQ